MAPVKVRSRCRRPAAAAGVTPREAIELLREGNRRFVSGDHTAHDFGAQVEATSAGQHPFAAVVGCIDSRVPPEIVFDQGLGDLFVVRVAGNVIGPDQLASLEFACSLAGARLVVILGHTRCGAVVGALEGRELGHLTGLLEKIRPAADVGGADGEARVPNDSAGTTVRSVPPTPELVAQVAEANVRLTIERVRGESEVLVEMESAGEIAIVGAMYAVETGEVRFL